LVLSLFLTLNFDFKKCCNRHIQIVLSTQPIVLKKMFCAIFFCLAVQISAVKTRESLNLTQVYFTLTQLLPLHKLYSLLCQITSALTSIKSNTNYFRDRHPFLLYICSMKKRCGSFSYMVICWRTTCFLIFSVILGGFHLCPKV